MGSRFDGVSDDDNNNNYLAMRWWFELQESPVEGLKESGGSSFGRACRDLFLLVIWESVKIATKVQRLKRFAMWLGPSCFCKSETVLTCIDETTCCRLMSWMCILW